MTSSITRGSFSSALCPTPTSATFSAQGSSPLACGACGSTYRLDLRAELLGKVLDVAVRRAIVEGVDHIDTMPRELAPHGKPNAIVDQYAMHQNNGQLPRSREGIMYHQPMQCHQ